MQTPPAQAYGHGRDALRKRRREEPAVTPSTRARRPRRSVSYADPEPDDDEEDFELGPPDDDDGWD